MRIVWVWVVASFLMFSVSVSWWISQPVVIGMSRAINSTIYENANARNVATAVEYVSYAWGPLLNIFILLWAVINSQKRDIESEVYS